MLKTVVGTFESRHDAEQVAARLIERGFDWRDIDLRARDIDRRATERVPGSPGSRESSSWWDWLFGESDDRSYYSERIDRGGAILAVKADERGAERARQLMESQGAEVDTRAQPTQEAEPSMREGIAQIETAGTGRPGADGVRLPKRPVASGVVRVYIRVVERPVGEHVSPREQHVQVDRRPVDRAIDAAAAFRDDVIKVDETGKQAVVAKEARAVGEVVDSKNAEVDRREDPAESPGAVTDDADLRRHWMETGATQGVPYEQFDPAYRLGSELAGDGGDWFAIEPEARRRWEEQNPGTWERFVDSIRYAWERAGQRRAA